MMPMGPFCEARHATFNGWSGVYPRCFLAPGHDGPHQTSYGLKFNDDGETIQ